MTPSDCIFGNVVLWDEIWSYMLDCAFVYRSRRVSKQWKAWIDVTLRARYNYDRFLTAYFPTKAARCEFRELQAVHGAIISGSKALDFLGKFGFAAKSDTDIYATYDGVVAIGTFFTEQGYTYLGNRPWLEDIFDVTDEKSVYSSCDVIRVFKFNGPTPSLVKIDLVLVADAPWCSILHFHAIMNGLLWDRAVAVHPEATFKYLKGLALYGADEDAVQKYRDRGFQVDLQITGVTSEFGGCLPTSPRSFDDAATWTVKFDTSGVNPTGFVSQPESNCFSLRTIQYGEQTSDGLQISAFYMMAMAFEHRLLNAKYAMHHACRPFAKRILGYLEEHSSRRTRSSKWRVRLVSYNHALTSCVVCHALTSWDNIMPFIVRAWTRKIPLFLRRGRKDVEFRP